MTFGPTIVPSPIFILVVLHEIDVPLKLTLFPIDIFESKRAVSLNFVKII